MTILFAPSEGKKEGGEFPPFKGESLIFPELYSKRLEVLEQYHKLIEEGSEEELSELFGLKERKEFERYLSPFEDVSTMKAIERYDGVAYDYLKFNELPLQAQKYLEEHVLIFSNLFGPIRAGDAIPDYKLKQGASIATLAPEKLYKKYFSSALDEWIGDDEVLDLRAGFYDKFYVPHNSITTLKFLKKGKVVSHWAKAYRGIVLREMAIHQIDSLEAFQALNIDGLCLCEIQESKKKKELIYEII